LLKFNKEAVLRDFLYDSIKSAIDKKDNSIIQQRGLEDLFCFMERTSKNPLAELKVFKEFVIPHYGVCDVVVVKNDFLITGNEILPYEQQVSIYAIEVKNDYIEPKHYNQILRYVVGLSDSFSFYEIRSCIIGTGMKESHYLCTALNQLWSEYDDSKNIPLTYEASFDLNGVMFKLHEGFRPSAIQNEDDYWSFCIDHYRSIGAIKNISVEEKEEMLKTLEQ